MPSPSIPLGAIRLPAFLHGPDGAIIGANALAEALAGRPLAGLSPADVIRTFGHRRSGGAPLVPGELPACRALAGEEVVEDPVVVTLADGRTIDVLASASAVLDGDAVTGALVIWQDVTERTRAEEALGESEERFRALYEHNRDAIILAAPSDGERIIDANPAASRMFGYADGELVGRSGREVVHDPDSPEAVATLRERDRAGTATAELIYRRRDGSTFPGEVSSSLFTDSHGQLRTVSVIRDVTVRRGAEEERARYADALRASQDQLRDVIAATGAGFFHVSLLAGRGTLSPRGAELLGFATQEMPSLLEIAAEAQARMHPDDIERVIGSFMSFVEADTARQEMEFRVRTPGGGWRWVQAIGTTAERDEVGHVVSLAGFLFDIDERKRAEESRRESEERLRLAQESAQIGIWDRDIATDTVRISPEFLRPYGLEEISVSRYVDLVPLMHPDDRAMVEAGRYEAFATGGPLTLESRVRIPSGEYRWIQFKGRGVADDRGNLVRVIGLLIDVTDRRRTEIALRESEADARSFFVNMVDACAICETVCNEHGEPVDIRLVDVNPAFARALSLPTGVIVGQTAFMILPALAREWFDLFLQVSRERAFIEIEDPFPALDRWYHITAFPVRHGRVAVVFRDITETLEAEAERARFTRELARSNEELQRFAYVASHDLQEPLRSIVSFSQLLERRYQGRLDTDADEYIEFIVEGGNRMQRLIEDLLQLSRVETTARPLEPTDAAVVLDDVIHSMESAIREAGATVTVGDMPSVMADAAQLGQVFSNLIGNALKYRQESRPPEVRISAEREGGVWRFAVADNGIGIEPEYFERIFVIFQRLHTKEAYPGTGIGLAIVKRIIDRHGGTIRVESTPGEGSTFFFTLPAA